MPSSSSSAPIYFIHIPKTGGTSIATLLREQYRSDQLVFVYNDEFNLVTPNLDFASQVRPSITQVKIVYGHYFYGAHELLGTPPRYMAVLRDPFERVLSFYNHHARVPQWPYYTMIRNGLGVDGFVRGFVDYQVNNLMTRMIAGVRERDGARILSREHLDRALENVRRSFVFVATMEDLAAGTDILAQRLGWKEYQLPRLNADEDRFVPTLDADARAAIEESNRLDIELYQVFKDRPYENFAT